jgi:hypothetical protein
MGTELGPKPEFGPRGALRWRGRITLLPISQHPHDPGSMSATETDLQVST